MTATRLFDRAVIRLSPREGSADNVADFLQGLVTSDVKKVLPVWAGMLTPQGKVLFDFMVWPAGEDMLLDCEAAAAEALIKRLTMYRLRKAIDIARDDSLAVHWRPHVGDGAAADPRLSALGERWVSVIDEADPEDSERGADAAWRAHRLALGVPEGQAELGDGETLWLECNAAELNGACFTKGCFVGQENTARMNWRQKVNRRLIVVPLDRSDDKRRRAAYPDLGLAVDHLRVDDIAPDLMPAWLDLSAAS
ncbi:YgfZ/GcvT domain-containing protein [Novosphingobium album (ex Hu et al. 2023)]|uniref:Folate-binding protein n=1 Tax=Novosphingobium album (ex Hu et al. 2023) TaxID=2930093 RepID=A0ABT0B0G1_9SPHN|nr:folate-binding protein [Novosphingobium album (ex Hu et al. 2023)]MCJ2178534.1 folate-binding protein [Novosphingobium album (ex Hu et al. 2023)]